MNYIYSTVNTLRDRYTPVRTRSTFRQSGEITPDEFLAAGDYLVFKFPTWSWADADDPSRRVPHLPAGKQFLVSRNVACVRWNDYDAHEEIVADGADFRHGSDGGWLRTRDLRIRDEMGSRDEMEIPNMDEMDEIAMDDVIQHEAHDSRRTYNLYIMYSPFYRTPRLYLSGYANGQPLAPRLMMEDIVGDYHDKTVTVEDFPFLSTNVKMASVHPCRHAAVMKTMLDHADAALKLRRERNRAVDGLVRGMDRLDVRERPGDEWEEVGGDDIESEAVRVDQYLVVFLKFMASVTPGIEHDQTMGV